MSEPSASQIRALSIEAFCELVNKHKTSSTVVYVDQSTKSLVAVLSNRPPCADAVAGFRDYRIVYDGPVSNAWKSLVRRRVEGWER